MHAFSYISRSFRTATHHIIGALKLLADSYTPEELNRKGWSLYAEFRPMVNEWGSRSEIHCKNILDLRKKSSESTLETITKSQKPTIHNEAQGLLSTIGDFTETPSKKAKILTVEEYEDMLDQDTTFDSVNLDFPDVASLRTTPPLSSSGP